MSARHLNTIAVVCASCGKSLRGTPTLVGAGYHVRRHKNDATGRRCLGDLTTKHRRAS